MRQFKYLLALAFLYPFLLMDDIQCQDTWFRRMDHLEDDDYTSFLLTSGQRIFAMHEFQDGNLGPVGQVLTCFSLAGDTIWSQEYHFQDLDVYDGPALNLLGGDFLVDFILVNYRFDGEYLINDRHEVRRISPDGTVKWSYTIPAYEEQDYLFSMFFYSIIQFREDDIRLYFRMSTIIPGDPILKKDGYIVLDRNGVEIRRHYYDRGGIYHWPYWMIRDSSGNLFQMYRDYFEHNYTQHRIDKLNALEMKEWTFQTEKLYLGGGSAITLDRYGNFYFTYKYKPDPEGFLWYPSISSIDTSGKLKWMSVFGESGSGFQGFADIITTSDNRILTCGYESNPQESDYTNTGWIVCTDTAGVKLWERRYIVDEADNFGVRFFDLQESSDHGLALFGDVFNKTDVNQRDFSDGILIKTDDEGCVTPGCGLYNHISFLTLTSEPPRSLLRFLLHCAGNNLYILGDSLSGFLPARYMITSTDGAVQLQEQLWESQGSIDVARLASGYYVFSLFNPKGNLLGSTRFFKP